MTNKFEEELAARKGTNKFQAELEERNAGFNPFTAAGEAIVDFGSSIAGAIEGQNDPAFEGVPGFTGEGLNDIETITAINRAKVLGVSDETYGQLVKDALGIRLSNVEKDKFGQEVITYTDDFGNERREFINEPGADTQDLDRVISASVPFLAAGGAVGTAVKGAPLAFRAGAQAAGQIGASVAQDVAADAPLDLTKAGVSAAGGAVGELAAPAVRSIIEIFKSNRGLINPATGQLTSRGVRILEEAGIDPGDASPEFLESLASADVPKTSDQMQAVIRAQTDEFGIRSSQGQRSLDPNLLSIEEQSRRGLLGSQAKTAATEFDAGQRSDIIGALNVQGERLGGDLAPPVTAGEAGERLQAGLQTEIARGDEAISQAFGEVDPDAVFPGGIPTEQFDDLATRINQNLGTLKITDEMPASKQAVELLDAFSKGEAVLPELGFLQRGAQPLQNFDDVRRSINTSIGQAANAQDKAATTAIKRSYNEWLGDLANGALEDADAAEFAKLQAAIGLTAKVKGLFKARGPKDAGGKILEKITDTVDSPEGAISTLFQSGFKAGPKAGAIDAVKRMKTILQKDQPEAWHAMRQALWLKMTRSKNLFKEGPISRQELDTAFGQINRNITDAFDNQKSMLDVLYTEAEQKQMRKFASSARQAQSVNPNPSGTAFEAQRMKKAATDNLLVNFLKRQAASEQLAKNSARAVAFRVLAQRAVSLFGARGEGLAGRAAGRTFSPALPKQRRISGAGNQSGAAAVQAQQLRDNIESQQQPTIDDELRRQLGN